MVSVNGFTHQVLRLWKRMELIEKHSRVVIVLFFLSPALFQHTVKLGRQTYSWSLSPAWSTWMSQCFSRSWQTHYPFRKANWSPILSLCLEGNGGKTLQRPGLHGEEKLPRVETFELKQTFPPHTHFMDSLKDAVSSECLFPINWKKLKIKLLLHYN